MEEKKEYPKYMYSNNPNHTKDPSLLLSLLDSVWNVEGAIVEIGVWKGDKFLLFVKRARCQSKQAVAIDSFRGFAKPGEYDKYYPEGDLDVGGANWLRKKVEGISNVFIYEGYIPKILDEVEIMSISFVHIDVDQYLPTKQSIKWAWGLLSIGGIMVCHDYLPNDKHNCSKAIDEFIRETNLRYDGLQNTWAWWVKK